MSKKELIAYIKAHLENILDLSEANLSEADLSEADLRWADLSEADLRWADLRWADLRWANLRWANLRWANLRWANLRWANLRWADLSKANLRWADLSKANLSEANLSKANLSEANLRGADLSKANLSEAIIEDYRFNAEGLSDETVKHLMALDFQWLGKDAKKIVEDAISTQSCPFKGIKPPFYILAGNYWSTIQGYFTSDLSFKEIWAMVVRDLNKAREEAE